MVEMTPQRWRYTGEYSTAVFGAQDKHLAGLMRDATAAGLPDIAVSADVGRLLMMLVSMTPGRLALEIGTLGGYSAIWIARGLAAAGRLITIERDPEHAGFARRQLQRAGVADRVEVRVGEAKEVLAELSGRLDEGALDVVFIDADKTEYPGYWRLVRPLIAPGGLLLADNVYGSGSWWIDQEGHPTREAAHRFNTLVAGDPQFEAVAVPLRQGVLVARRRDQASPIV